MRFKAIQYDTVKVSSKSQKEILDCPHTPKNQRNFVHFFDLASKSGQIEKKGTLLASF